MNSVAPPTPHWKIIVAAVLDFLTIFFIGGYAVATLTGGITANGFNLTGWGALLALVVIVLYFVIGNRTGGTIWKRILGVAPKS